MPATDKPGMDPDAEMIGRRADNPRPMAPQSFKEMGDEVMLKSPMNSLVLHAAGVISYSPSTSSRPNELASQIDWMPFTSP